jgi:RNA polymerase sigma-70 factor, ECF subfamily
MNMDCLILMEIFIMIKSIMKNDNFEDIVSRYDKRIDTVIVNFEKNTENARDIKQELYLKFLNKKLYLHDGINAWSWVKTVVVNHCKNYIRDNSKFKFYDPVDNENKINLLENIEDKKCRIENNVDYENLQNYIYDCVCELKSKYKDVIILYDFENMNYEEMAEKLNCPVGTIKSRLFKARMLLKEKLKDLME